jgi:hypothetical protein
VAGVRPEAAAEARVNAFARVQRIGLTLPGVEAATNYDGAPRLKLAGCFVAGLATHPSVEPATLVVRADPEEREWLLADAPDTYYLTDYYRKYPLVLVRLQRIDDTALAELLLMSRNLTVPKTRTARARRVAGPGEAGRERPRGS